jgi:putative endonuclease
MAHMYILKCADGTFYVGSTRDLEVRLGEHRLGLGANYTRRRLPVELVYCEDYHGVDEAFYREKQIQNWSHAKRLALIEGRIDDLKKLSRRKGGA